MGDSRETPGICCGLRPRATSGLLFLSVFPPPSMFSLTLRGVRLDPLGPSLVMVAGALSAWTLLQADAWARTNWPYFSNWEHWTGGLGLYAGIGALFGLLVFGLVAIERWLVQRGKEARSGRSALRASFYGGVGGLSSISTAIWTFSGEKAQQSALALVGPLLFAGSCALAAAVGAWLLIRGFRWVEERRFGWIGVCAAFFGAGAVIAQVDLTWYVSLYSRVHTLMELTAALCFGAAYALLLLRLARIRALALTILGSGGALGVWLLACVSVPPVRAWFDETLKHVWLEEVYVGRMLRRTQVAEAFFANPFGWEGMHMARLSRLKKRYSVDDLSLAPKWEEPLAEAPEIWDALRELRGGQKRLNVLVYYVDTLRADVAADATAMPGLARFRKDALDFRRAYATGSDTLRSLPALTGGNYDVFTTPPNDLLRVAKRADYDTVLVSAKSAFEFVGKLRPEFSFDRSLVMEDYPAEQQVWGYGAQRPTAPGLVDRALSYLDESRGQPFFLWLFNFDQHNWRELDAEYIEENARRFGIVDDPSLLPYRYRVVARAIDREFERMVQALEQRRLLESTVILFVSDHGEALGRDGFWVHSVFLWESLIRVPLVLRVPGLEPKQIDRKVSLVDVAPTLGRFMDPTLNGRGFQGEDLLANLLSPAPPRRFPLLLMSASKDLLVRVGIVDPVEDFKLLVSFEAALPELYDLRIPEPDAANFAAGHPERVRRSIAELVRSPVFPRSADDFDVRDTKEQKALALPVGGR